MPEQGVTWNIEWSIETDMIRKRTVATSYCDVIGVGPGDHQVRNVHLEISPVRLYSVPLHSRERKKSVIRAGSGRVDLQVSTIQL